MAIWNLCNKPDASWWSFLFELEALTKLVDSYASFLKSSNEVQLRNQALSYPARQLKDYVTVQHIPANSTVVDAYKLLNAAVMEANEHAPVF